MQTRSLKRKNSDAPRSEEPQKPYDTAAKNARKDSDGKKTTAQTDYFTASGEIQKESKSVRLPGEKVIAKNNSFFMQPLSKQPASTQSLFLKAAESSFNRCVPYVFAVRESSLVSLLPDLGSTIQQMCEALHQANEMSHPMDEVWGQMATDWQFFAFIDKDSQAIKIGTIEELRKKKIFGSSILSDLLLTGEESGLNETRAIYKELTEDGILSQDFHPLLEKAKKEFGSESQRWGAEELLISASADGCLFLVESLLKKNVDPNAFSSATGDYAINTVSKESEAYKMLEAYGADITAKAEDPHC